MPTPALSYASRQKMRPEAAGVDVCIIIASLVMWMFFASFRPQWRSVKKFVRFFVKKKKLFERSEFFFFRKKVQILASEMQTANFFCFVFFVRAKKMKSPCG